MNDKEIKYESWNVCRVGYWFAVQYREKQPVMETVKYSIEAVESEDKEE